jgi:hypothetical protein
VLVVNNRERTVGGLVHGSSSEKCGKKLNSEYVLKVTFTAFSFET